MALNFELNKDVFLLKTFPFPPNPQENKENDNGQIKTPIAR